MGGLHECKENTDSSDTAQNFNSIDPTLHQGELGFDITNKRIKCGDGFTSWSQLDYIEEAGLAQIREEYGDELTFEIGLNLTIN